MERPGSLTDEEIRIKILRPAPLPRQPRDLCVVTVGVGGFEKALRVFKKSIGESGHLRVLRGRQLFPSVTARRRAKLKAAMLRRRKEAKAKNV